MGSRVRSPRFHAHSSRARFGEPGACWGPRSQGAAFSGTASWCIARGGASRCEPAPCRSRPDKAGNPGSVGHAVRWRCWERFCSPAQSCWRGAAAVLGCRRSLGQSAAAGRKAGGEPPAPSTRAPLPPRRPQARHRRGDGAGQGRRSRRSEPLTRSVPPATLSRRWGGSPLSSPQASFPAALLAPRMRQTAGSLPSPRLRVLGRNAVHGQAAGRRRFCSS